MVSCLWSAISFGLLEALRDLQRAPSTRDRDHTSSHEAQRLQLVTVMSADIADSMDTASLDVIVPEDSDFYIDNFLRLDTRSEGNQPSSELSLSTIPQRNVLHFGMLSASAM